MQIKQAEGHRFQPFLIYSFQFFIVNWVTWHSCNRMLIWWNINSGPSNFIVMRFHNDLLKQYTSYTERNKVEPILTFITVFHLLTLLWYFDGWITDPVTWNQHINQITYLVWTLSFGNFSVCILAVFKYARFQIIYNRVNHFL